MGRKRTRPGRNNVTDQGGRTTPLGTARGAVENRTATEPASQAPPRARPYGHASRCQGEGRSSFVGPLALARGDFNTGQPIGCPGFSLSAEVDPHEISRKGRPTTAQLNPRHQPGRASGACRVSASQPVKAELEPSAALISQDTGARGVGLVHISTVDNRSTILS